MTAIAIFGLALITMAQTVPSYVTIIFNDQWGNSYPSTLGSSYLRGICPTSNGIITSGGYYGALTDQYTKTIDSNGVVIWSAQRSPGGGHDSWLDVDRLDNGNFICYGQQNALGTSYFDAAWVVYDNFGNEVNAGFFPIPGSTSGRCLEKLSSGNLVSVGPIGGGAAVYLTNQNMNSINNVNIYSPGWGIQRIVHDSDDVFIIGTDPGSSELMIYRFTHNLVPIDTFSYNFPNPGFVHGAVLKDNLIHLVGIKTISGNNHGFLLIIDLNGNIVYSSIDANPSAYYAIGVHQNELFYTSTNFNAGSTAVVDSKIIHYPSGASHTLYGGVNFNPQNIVSIGNSLYLCGDLGQWIGGTAAVIKLNVAVQTCNSSFNTITADGITTFCAGNYVNLTSDVVGGTYQWKKNGVNITTNATSRTYKATATGSYTCAATCNGTALTSNAIAITSKTNAAVTLTATGATSFCAGDSVTLNATNLGSNYSIQWYRSNISIDNATGYTQVIKQPGTYKVVTKNLTTGCSRISGSAITTIVNCRIANSTDNNNNGTSDNLVTEKITGNDISEGISIYPNPNNGTFVLEYEGEQSGSGFMQVVNSMGQTIYESNVEVADGLFSKEVKLGDNISKGIYVVRLLINGSVNDSRIIVK